MKLVQFGVNNYRCIQGGIEQNTIKFGDANTIFIFGQNNVGKSSFLRAYEAFYRSEVTEDDFSFVYGKEQRQNIELELWLLVEDSDKEVIDTVSNGKYASLASNFLDDEHILKVRKVWSDIKGSRNFTWDPKANDWVEKNYGGIGLDQVFQSMLPKPLFIQAMPTEAQVKEIVNNVLKEVAKAKFTKKQLETLDDAYKVIEKLQDEVYDQKTIREYERKVNQEFGKLFGSYKIAIDDGKSKVAYTADKLGKDFEIDFRHIENNQPTKHDRMGHGAVRMAIFLLMLLRDELQGAGISQKSCIVLFEEPELFLHPKLTKKLRNLVYDVSARDMPFQVLCASHSPQMIDISKDDSTIIRMLKGDKETKLYQVQKEDLTNSSEKTLDDVKQKVHEILRFNPFVCESFYADEVVLVEGDTEAIMFRGYQQEFEPEKDIFVVNCGSCTNIPFFQKMFSKFNIPYSVICDTDHYNHKKGEDPGKVNRNGWDEVYESPNFSGGIQKSIAEQFAIDKKNGLAKHFFVCAPTFEPFHETLTTPFTYKATGAGKAVSANEYWEQLAENKQQTGFDEVPIIKYIKAIV